MRCRLFCRCDAVGIELFAIGHNDHCSGVPLGFSKCFLGGGDGGGDVGSAFGNDIGIELSERIDDGRVIQRERRLEEGGAGEGHQPDPVAFQEAHQILREKFRPREAVGSDVGRQHAARGINRHDDVAALLFHLLLGKTVAGLGERDEGEREDGQHEERTEDPASHADRSCELAEQPWGYHLCHKRASSLLRPCVEERKQRQYQKPPKPDRGTKCQGSRLHKVCESRISATRQARPAMRTQGKRSR